MKILELPTRVAQAGHFDHRFGWYIIVGSIPIGIVGFVGKDVISGPLRSLWWVGGALVLWSAVMVYAERRGAQNRSERDLTMTDSILATDEARAAGNIRQFTIAPILAEAMQRISDETSVSSLFD